MRADIVLKQPANVNTEELAEFIHDALTSWGSQRHPADPLFSSLDIVRIRINHETYTPSTDGKKLSRT